MLRQVSRRFKFRRFLMTEAEKLSNVRDQIESVITVLKSENIFEEQLLRNEVDHVLNKLMLPPSFFTSFTIKQLSDSLIALLSAKMVARRTGSAVDFRVETQDYALFCCAMMPNLLEKMNNDIQRYSRSTATNLCPSTAFFRSGGNIAQDIPYPLGVAVVSRSPYASTTPFVESSESFDIKQLVHEEFSNFPKKIQERYEKILKRKSETLTPVTEIYERKNGKKVIMIAFNKTARNTGFWTDLSDLLESTSIESNIERKFAIRFANNVLVYTFYVSNATDSQISTFLNNAALLDILPNSDLQTLLHTAHVSANQVAYGHAAAMFAFYFGAKNTEEYRALKKILQAENKEENISLLKAMNRRLHRGPTESYSYDVIRRFPEILSRLYIDFVEKVSGQGVGQHNQELRNLIDKEVGERSERNVLLAFLQFNTYVRKTNFFQPLKSALSFRLDPGFLEWLDFPEIPHGVFFLMGRDFKGFHVRFRDIARGGVRMIRSANPYSYETNSLRLFDECYGLANTQQKKNKDIPEGGSKGNFLLQYGYEGNGFLSFQRYMDAFLDVLLPNENVRDNVGQEEIIFFGPDEGTAEWMDWAALYSKQRGYSMWKSLTTGKAPSLGGIPHDVYGMTTLSVHRMAVEVLKKLGWKEEEVTKFQTGGPDGDLGFNEIRMSKDKTISIVDGSGVVFDPQGLNRDELMRLAKARKMISNFDVSRLGPEGFRVLIDERNVQLPSGELVEDGMGFRNTFHLHALAKADLFVPCGGRPEAVNMNNVNLLLNKDGTPKFKVIVEGANLFITEDARLVLERAGVILFKDATANKGGVTSSSHEVLAGLCLTDEQHKEWMCENNGVLPEFYKGYVEEIQERIQNNAKSEFDCIWREHEETKIPRTQITILLSDKINALDDYIRSTNLFDTDSVRLAVMSKAIPKMLLDKVGLETILQRVPDAYQRAIFSNFIASHYVYQYGLRASEVGFFEFMRKLLS